MRYLFLAFFCLQIKIAQFYEYPYNPGRTAPFSILDTAVPCWASPGHAAVGHRSLPPAPCEPYGWPRSSVRFLWSQRVVRPTTTTTRPAAIEPRRGGAWCGPGSYAPRSTCWRSWWRRDVVNSAASADVSTRLEWPPLPADPSTTRSGVWARPAPSSSQCTPALR